MSSKEIVILIIGNAAVILWAILWFRVFWNRNETEKIAFSEWTPLKVYTFEVKQSKKFQTNSRSLVMSLRGIEYPDIQKSEQYCKENDENEHLINNSHEMKWLIGLIRSILNGDSVKLNLALHTPADKFPVSVSIIPGIIVLTIFLLIASYVYYSNWFDIGPMLVYMVMIHAFAALLFAPSVYRPYQIKENDNVYNRLSIRSIPLGCILLILLSMDFVLIFKLSHLTSLMGIGFSLSLQIKATLAILTAYAGIANHMRKKYLKHCDMVGITEDPQPLYWLFNSAGIAGGVMFLAWVWLP